MTQVEIESIRSLLERSLEEDIGSGDVTSDAIISPLARARAEYVAKESAVVCGLELVRELARMVDGQLHFRSVCADGDAVSAGDVMASIEGSARSILAVERVSLNFLQRLTGIATTTHRYVARVSGTRTRVLDTRKTVPGYRILDKYAVRCGGGLNHRAGLFDAILIKNNHLVFHADLGDAVRMARERADKDTEIEVEVRSFAELRVALDSAPDRVMIDNFSPDDARRAVAIVDGRVPVEASGGITLESMRLYADAGVDYVSVGALTHSVRAVDIHLRLHPLDS